MTMMTEGLISELNAERCLNTSYIQQNRPKKAPAIVYAHLTRKHYAEWLQFVKDPKVGHTHYLLYLRGRPTLILTLCLSTYCCVISLDPDKPFMNLQVDSDTTIPLGSDINGEFSVEVA